MYLAVQGKRERDETQFMIVFKDPGNKISKFFAEVKSSYSRASSHFHSRRPGKVYGLDIVADGKNDLPAHKNTAHFGALETLDKTTQWSFLKPEDYGLGSVSQWLLHAWDYIKGRPARLLGLASQEGERKEHTDPVIKSHFQTLHHKITNKKPDADFSTYGISKMVQFFHEHMKTTKDSIHKNDIKAFAEKHLQNYDCLLVRMGDELIIEDLIAIDNDDPSTKKALAAERKRLNKEYDELIRLCN